MIRKLLLITALALCACSRLSSVKGVNLDPALFSVGDSDLVPSSDKIAPDCTTNPAYDACIIYKNPVAQKGSGASEADLNQLLQYGVKIRSLSPTGNLENNHVQILTLNTPRFSLLDPTKFKAAYSANQSYVEQVMTYYWANRIFEYLEPRIGSQRLPATGLKIYVDDIFTGFSKRNFSISLEKAPGKIPKALSAEAVIQLTGQAFASNLSGGKIFDTQNFAQHKSCGLSVKGCCSTFAGCANALASSVGDYLSGIMFPTRPVLGESLAGSLSGQAVCGMNRNLQTLSLASQSAVFSACNGNVTLEGSWYASLWWTARTQAENAEKGASQDIDAIFFDHARAWTATSTFTDAKQSAISVATNYKSGKYLTLIQNVLGAIQ